MRTWFNRHRGVIKQLCLINAIADIFAAVLVAPFNTAGAIVLTVLAVVLAWLWLLALEPHSKPIVHKYFTLAIIFALSFFFTLPVSLVAAGIVGCIALGFAAAGLLTREYKKGTL